MILSRHTKYINYDDKKIKKIKEESYNFSGI